VRSGLFFADDRSVDNVRLVRALAASAVSRGAVVLSGRPVSRLIVEGGVISGVVAGAERFATRVVVNATGAWAGGIPGDPLPPPVEPVRGHIVAFDVPAGFVDRVLCSHRGYVVPRSDGRLLAGSTVERVGFDKSVTAGAVQAILAIALEIAPRLAEARIAQSWAGLRPGTPDDLPIVGKGAVPGLFHATGLYRNGILLGPLVGEAVARLAQGRAPEIDLGAFAPDRFRR
jgi:glycine oxidase